MDIDVYCQIIHENLTHLMRLYPNLEMEKAKIQKDMFKRPNMKGMQSILYSLIWLIDSAYCKKCIPWPVGFTSDNYKFRTAVIDFIIKECTDFEAPKLLPSLLNKTEGEKYVKFIHDFSVYVLKVLYNRQFGHKEPLLEKPNASIPGSLEMLRNITLHMLQEEQLEEEKFQRFVKNNSAIYKETECDLALALQEKKEKKQQLASILGDKFSGNFEADQAAVDEIVNESTQQLIQMQQEVCRLEKEVEHILDKKLYINSLLEAKRNQINECAVDMHELGRCLNEDFSSAVRIPINEIISSLFPHQDDQICLKTFFKLGTSVVHSHIERFASVNPREKHLDTCRNANVISESVGERLQKLISLELELDKTLHSYKYLLANLKPRNFKDYTNDPYYDVLSQLASLGDYCPNINTRVEQKPLLHGFFAESPDHGTKNPVDRIKEKMNQLNGTENAPNQ